MPFTIALMMRVSHSSVGLGKLEFWAAAGAIFGAFLFVRGFQMLRSKRLILNTPASKIRSACMGLVEISGTASGPKTIPAGISGDPCYYYRATAWQLRQTGRNRQWVKVADECVYVPFFVEDSTGQMLVDPAGADLDIHRNFNDEFGDSLFNSREMMRTNVGSFLMRNGLVSFDTTRLEEYCIKPDYPLFVFGTLGKNPDRGQWVPVVQKMSGTSFKSRLSLFGPASTAAFQLLTSSVGIKSAQSTILTSSLDATGVAAIPAKLAPEPASTRWSSVTIDDDVVQSVRDHTRASAVATQVAPEVAKQVAPAPTAAPSHAVARPPSPESDGSDPNCSTKIGKGTDGQPFMISWQSQREVIQSLAWKSALCIWGGPILSLGCTYILLLSWGLL